MSERPKDLPKLDPVRLAEIRNLLTHESSVSFQSFRAHESMWMLHDAAVRALANAPIVDLAAITDLLSSTVFHCFDDEEFGLSAKHAVAVTDALLAAGIVRDEATVKAEALRDAATAAREEAANSRTNNGRCESESLADWLDDRATEIDPARLEGAHP